MAEQMMEPFKRANFFPGLQAGPVYWNAIEDYHFKKEVLYNHLFHGTGIVPGYMDALHVQAEKTKGGLLTLLIGCGLAFDGMGRPLFVYEPQVLVLDPKKFHLPQTVFVVLRYEERMEDFYQNRENSDLQGYQHKLETVKVEIVDEIADPAVSIELARIQLADSNGAGISEIRNNNDFCDPGINSLDYRFVPYAVHVKQGISGYLQQFLIGLFETTRSIAASGYDVVPVVSLKNLQTVAMTAKMIMQTSGVFFNDVIHLVSPLFDLDHQVLFDIAEFEREQEQKERLYTTKTSYEQARAGMYELGELVKGYNSTYEEIDLILKAHGKVMEGIKQTLIQKEVSSDDIKYISYQMPHVLLFGEDRYTLVDTVNMASAESREAHRMEFIGSSHPSISNEAFYYPDGKLVHDTVRRWIGGSLSFRLKNIVKGRKTLIIRRTDIHRGNYSVDVVLEKKVTHVLDVDGVDTKNRWRNLFVIFDEGEITEYTPEISFTIGEKGRDNAGTIWVYQLL